LAVVSLQWRLSPESNQRGTHVTSLIGEAPNEKGPTKRPTLHSISLASETRKSVLQPKNRISRRSGQLLKMKGFAMSQDKQSYIFRQCITLRNGRRICKPHGQAFRIPVSDDKPKDEDA